MEIFIMPVMTLLLFPLFFAQVPITPPTFQMNKSTIIMPCNYTGFTDPSTTKGWAVIDFDWSNAKGRGTSDGWAKQKPMDCEERLVTQVHMTATASPGTTVWVYRNSIKALPWYTSVREKLEDPAYANWFMNFGGTGSYHVPTCDNNYSPPLCSNFYHDQSQTPEFPHGDGDCAKPACDVGKLPIGEYLFNPLAANVSVKGQTFTEWFIDDYLFGPNGGSNVNVSGFFFDDAWGNHGPTEYEKHILDDLNLTQSQSKVYQIAYKQYMAVVFKAVLARKKFSWQQLWTGGNGKGSTCPRPFVTKSTCATQLRSLCQTSSPAQTRAMMYAFTPGGCATDPSNLTQFDEDLANFLLVRGNYSWLGHGWLGCSRIYQFPSALNEDYGSPTELCKETAPNSQIFQRDWTKAVVEMNCNTYAPKITMK